MYICCMTEWCSARIVALRESPSTGTPFPLAVEVESGHRQSQVVLLGKVAGVEVVAERGRKDGVPAELLKQRED